jgi:integrase
MYQSLHSEGQIMAIALAAVGRQSPLQLLVEDYLAHCAARGLSPRTLDKCYGYPLRVVFLGWCDDQGITSLEELDGRVIDRFTATLLQRQPRGHAISKHTVHSYVRPVRQLLTWAAHVGESVKAKPQLPRLTKPIHDVLTRDEIDAMEDALPFERDKIIIRIFGDCGLRLQELTQLTPNDIVRSARQAHFRVLGKGNRMREVPIPPLTLRRLERLIRGQPVDRSQERIFLTLRRSPAGTYDGLTGNGVYQVVTDAVARAGITKHVHPHLLRHSWMTEMLRQGMNPLQLSLIAGTSVPVIMEHYTHLTKEDAYDAMMSALLPPKR